MRRVGGPRASRGRDRADLAVGDAAGLDGVVAGQDAVLCAIGAGPQRTTLREDGTRNIVAAMQRAGVRRLVCQSTLGVGDSDCTTCCTTPCTPGLPLR